MNYIIFLISVILIYAIINNIFSRSLSKKYNYDYSTKKYISKIFEYTASTFFPFGILCGFVMTIYIFKNIKIINPVEVYRNNTELIINKYFENDSLVKIDSVVVLKKDLYKK